MTDDDITAAIAAHYLISSEWCRCGESVCKGWAVHVLAALRGAGYEIVTTEKAKLISLENQPPSAPVAAEGDQ